MNSSIEDSLSLVSTAYEQRRWIQNYATGSRDIYTPDHNVFFAVLDGSDKDKVAIFRHHGIAEVPHLYYIAGIEPRTIPSLHLQRHHMRRWEPIQDIVNPANVTQTSDQSSSSGHDMDTDLLVSSLVARKRLRKERQLQRQRGSGSGTHASFDSQFEPGETVPGMPDKRVQTREALNLDADEISLSESTTPQQILAQVNARTAFNVTIPQRLLAKASTAAAKSTNKATQQQQQTAASSSTLSSAFVWLFILAFLIAIFLSYFYDVKIRTVLQTPVLFFCVILVRMRVSAEHVFATTFASLLKSKRRLSQLG